MCWREYWKECVGCIARKIIHTFIIGLLERYRCYFWLKHCHLCSTVASLTLMLHQLMIIDHFASRHFPIFFLYLWLSFQFKKVSACMFWRFMKWFKTCIPSSVNWVDFLNNFIGLRIKYSIIAPYVRNNTKFYRGLNILVIFIYFYSLDIVF